MHALGCLRRIVVGREVAAQDRVDVEEAQRAVGHEERLDALGLAGAGDRHRAAVPEPDVLEDAPLFAVDEVVRGRHVQERDPEPRRRVPQAHEPVGLVERQRLEQDAADDAEDGRVGADTERQREDGDQREHGGPEETPGHAEGRGSHREHIRPPPPPCSLLSPNPGILAMLPRC